MDADEDLLLSDSFDAFVHESYNDDQTYTFQDAVPHLYKTDAFYKLLELAKNDSQLMICGLSGSGKSQMAMHAAMEISVCSQLGLFKITASFMKEFLTRTSFLLQHLSKQRSICHSLCRETNKNELAMKLWLSVLHKLEQCKCAGTHVVIFDDVSRNMEEVVRCVTKGPAVRNVKFIVTTIDGNILEEWKKLFIEGFTEKESYEFLMKNQFFSSFPKEPVLNLARSMSCRPLGLITSRKYIKITQISIENYLNIQEEMSFSLKTDKAVRKYLGPSYKGLLVSQKLVIEQALKQLEGEEPDIHISHLLLACSLLKPENIPMIILKNMLPLTYSDNLANYSLGELTNVIKKYSLGSVTGLDDERIVTVHSVTHNVLSTFVKESERTKLHENLLESMVNLLYQRKRVRKKHMAMENLLPHCDEVLKHCSELPQTFENRFQECIMLDIVGQMYSQLGYLGCSKKYLLHALSILYNLLQRDDFSDVDPDQLFDSCIHISEKNFTNDFIKRFISKRISTDDDLAIIWSKYPGNSACQNQDPIKMYEKLCKDELCMPINDLRKTLFLEVFISVLYSYGCTYFYVKKICRKDEKEKFTHCLNLSYSLSRKWREKSKWAPMHYILTQRNGTLSLLLEPADDQEVLVHKAINTYLDLSKDEGKYYQLGILKLHGSNAHHLSVCHKQLLRCFLTLHDILDDVRKKQDLHQKAAMHINELQQQIEQLKNWEALKSFYFNTMQFWIRLGNEDKLRSVINLFESASGIESNFFQSHYIVGNC